MKGFCSPSGGDCNGDGLSSAVGALTHISSLLEAHWGEMENKSRISGLTHALYIKSYSQSSTRLCDVHKLEGI